LGFSSCKVLAYWETYVAGLEYLAIFSIPMVITAMIQEKNEGIAGSIGMLLLQYFQIVAMVVFVLGIAPIAEAHPHATVDLMESHSHDVHDNNFQENFIVHTFEDVIFSVFDFFKSVLFG